MEQQAIVIALVGLLGIGAQWIAWRTGWPAIVLMLAAGFLAGPVFHLIDPEAAFGGLLEPMVSIGVALILFEGGLSLDFRELRKIGEGVWRLVVLGVPLGWLFGSLAAYYVAGLVWPVAILFAGILVVTGPTVVIPLLRQSSVQSRPAAILKWEAIVNDPFGALCAVIAYEYFRLSANGDPVWTVAPRMLLAVAVAAGLGYAGARFVAWTFPRGYVPEYLKVPVLLVLVIGLFVASNTIEHESGLMAVTVMGIALANMHVASLRAIHPFKQNVAVLLVSGIFILLSASLDFNALRQFEWRFALFLLALLFLVRPATILASLAFSKVPWNERLFLAWIAPRGIVMVAISGLFALRLADLGYGDGTILIGLSFAVVVATIVAHGFTIDLVARWLGLKGATRPGLLLVGATSWSIALARQMHALGTPVLLVDTSWSRLRPARQDGIPTFHGEILNEATEHNLDTSPFQVLIAATDNEAYNTLVCSEFAPEFGTDAVYQLGGGEDDEQTVLPSALRGRELFKSGFGVYDVARRQLEGWEFRQTRLSDKFALDDAKEVLPDAANMLLIVRPGGQLRMFTHASAPTPQAGDTIVSYSPPQKAVPAAAAAKREARRKPAAKPRACEMIFGRRAMKPAIPMLIAAALLAGCEVKRGGEQEEPPPRPTETATLVEGSGGQADEPESIIRPDVSPSPVLDVPPDPLAATIGFPDGGYDLDPAALKLLHTVLVSDQAKRGWPVVLRGHTDSAGNDQGNLFASRKRAEAVADWLEQQGIDGDRISVIALGEQNPVAPNARLDGSPNEAGRAKNRRVEVWIAPPGMEPADAADASPSSSSSPGGAEG